MSQCGCTSNTCGLCMNRLTRELEQEIRDSSFEDSHYGVLLAEVDRLRQKEKLYEQQSRDYMDHVAKLNEELDKYNKTTSELIDKCNEFEAENTKYIKLTVEERVKCYKLQDELSKYRETFEDFKFIVKERNELKAERDQRYEAMAKFYESDESIEILSKGQPDNEEKK